MTQYHAQFLLDKEKDKPDARLRYRIKWDKNIVAFNLGYRVDIEKWSVEAQRCKANTTHGKKKVSASVINKKIQQFEQAFQNTAVYFETKRKSPNKQEFQSCFNNEIGRKKKSNFDKSFFECYQEFILKVSKSSNNRSEGTYRNQSDIKGRR
ncbi:MAG: hypothetical protein Q4B43_08820 [Bacteroidota bacterium]|nr:hypothetical protein [Bacteroidota bacterium]